MKKPKFVKTIVAATAIASVLYLFCIKGPADPFSETNTSCRILLKNSMSQQVFVTSMEDSVGKPVYIGVGSFLPKNIDSLRMLVTLKTSSAVVLDTVLRFFNTAKTYDTLWVTTIFKSAGENSVKTTGYTSFGKILIDSATILIHNRLNPNNLPPKWDVDTIRISASVDAAISINLIDTCKDPDNEAVFFSLVSEPPLTDAINNGFYGYTALASDIGSCIVHIIVADAAQAKDTLAIALTVLPIDTTPPTIQLRNPNKDSLSVNATSYRVEIICFDPSNISSIKCSMGADSFQVEHSDSIYSAIVTGLQANVYNSITFVAVDGSSRANDTSKTIYIKNDPGLQDITGPILRRVAPTRDSISSGLDSVYLQISASDQSNVASVVCRFGATTFAVKKSDSIYSAGIKGLVKNHVNRIDFIATDASNNQNKDSISFFIKYDPTVLDFIKPTMRLSSPKKDSSSVGTSSITVQIVAKDASEIASVRCNFKAVDFAMTAIDSFYSATITGLVANQLNKIRFIATDASSNGNKETLFVTVKYDPTIIDNQKPTMGRKTPAKDSMSVGTSSTTVSIVAKDNESGIASVACSFGSTTPTVTAADSIYSATVTGLVVNQFNRIRFIATDASSNGNKETLFVTVKYDPTIIDNQKPTMGRKTPAKDSVSVGTSSLTISIVAKDNESGIASVVCSFGSTTPTVTAADSIYSATVTGLVANQFNTVRFIATDASSNGNKETLFVTVKYDPTMLDTIKPSVYLRSPAKDSASVSSASVKVEVVAKDASGIGTVKCSFKGADLAVTAADSIYSASVGQLTKDQFNRVDFIVTDASVNKNTDTLTAYIKYDPSMTDNVPPTFVRISGPTSGSTVTAAAVSLVYAINDDNGVDSVYWTLNGARQADLSAGTGNQYTVSATLTLSHNNTIRIHARDKSTNHNRDSVTITLNYNQPPVANSQTDLTTPRATAKTITLTGSDPESDPLSGWTIVKAPPAGHAAVTGTPPTITYAPVNDFEGKDTITFTVSDGTSESGPGLIVITVTENNIPPTIVTGPGSVSVNKGNEASFTAVINSNVYPAPDYIRWVKNDADTVPGQTSLTFKITNTQYADAGDYKVVVRNVAGKAESNNATLTVRDNIKPTMTLLGASPMVVLMGSAWVDPGCTAKDDRDGDITVPAPNAPPMNTPGRYTLTYTVSDKAGNSEATTRIVCVEGWVQVASTSTSGQGFRTALGLDSVLYVNHDGKIEKLQGASFSQVGTLPSPYGTLRMSRDGTTPYYLTGEWPSGAQLYSFNGTSWQAMGARLSWDALNPTLAIGPNGMILSSSDMFGTMLGVVQYNSSGWTALGTLSDISYIGNNGFNDKYIAITDNATPYVVGPGVACEKYSSGSWVPTVGSDPTIANSSKASNIQVVTDANTVYVGFADDNPYVYRLDGPAATTWTQLQSLGYNAGPAFGLTASRDHFVYAAYNDGSDIKVGKCSSSSTQWDNIPSMGPRAAFTDANCKALSVEAGANVCYLVYLQGTDKIIVRQWHRQ